MDVETWIVRHSNDVISIKGAARGKIYIISLQMGSEELWHYELYCCVFHDGQ